MTEVTYPEGYQPTVDPGDWKQELLDIHDMLRAAGHNGPLRDTVPFAVGRAERITEALKAKQEAALASAYHAERGDDYFEAQVRFTEAAILAEAVAEAEDTQ